MERGRERKDHNQSLVARKKTAFIRKCRAKHPVLRRLNVLLLQCNAIKFPFHPPDKRQIRLRHVEKGTGIFYSL